MASPLERDGLQQRLEQEQRAQQQREKQSQVLSRILREELPVVAGAMEVARDARVGLVVVDEVNGFCTVGMGNLAPPSRNEQVEQMVRITNDVAREFSSRGLPILALLDTHDADRPEPPYPPHCIRGTGEEKLVPDLKWLESDAHTTLMEKDCINGFVGGIRADGSNAVVEWVSRHELEIMVVVGICTDICVMDFVLTMLSARNHGLLGRLQQIAVLAPACATYDLPRHVAEEIGRGPTAAHPQEATHHLGLYFMHSRGARIVNSLSFAT